MINLLSDERKDEIRAARANVILSRYIAIIVMAVLFLLAFLYVSYTLLEKTKSSADAIIQSNDVKNSSTQTQVDTLSTKLSQTKSVLNQEVNYSNVLITLGQLMPVGTILDSLDLNQSSFNGAPVEIKAYAKNAEAAQAIAAHFQTSPLFTSVTPKGTDSANGADGYPISVTLSVIFNKTGAK